MWNTEKMKTTALALLLLTTTAAVADGRAVLEGECMQCHLVDGQGGNKKPAPPMYAVWHHYRQAYPDRESFIAAMHDWLMQPHADKTVMKGAVKKFGLMEPVALSDEQATSVAAHLYDRPFALPESYLVHYNQQHGTKEHGYDGTERRAQTAAPRY